MIRREFLRSAAALATAEALQSGLSAAPDSLEVMTVLGPVAADALGVTLPHEHVLVDFIGADKVSRDRYDADEAFRVALPHLKRAREFGVRTFIECTPAYVGRDPLLLRRLAEGSGLHILTNTGYYGVGQQKFLPAHALTETSDQLAARWTGEWRNGIEETGIRPGFIKIAVEAGPLSLVARKLVQAATRTHRATGLTIASHTGNGAAALEQLSVAREEGLDGSTFIWVHAQNERDAAVHARAAQRGAWVSFDGLGPKTVERYVAMVRTMKERGLLDRVLVSHDAGWYHVGEPGGGTFRAFDTLFTELIPALRRAGLTENDIRQLTVANPCNAFAIRVRGSK
jgi:phosphotriesterase-related protein